MAKTPSNSKVARMLAKLPAMIRNHNASEVAATRIAAGIVSMSPRARSEFMAFQRAVDSEREKIDALIETIRAAASEARDQGKITQEQYDKIVSSSVGEVGALPLLVIPIAVAVAVVAVAGAFVVYQLVKGVDRQHRYKREQWQRFLSLPPGERGEAVEFVEAQNKGGGVLPSLALGGGVSLGVMLVGGLILISLLRR